MKICLYTFNGLQPWLVGCVNVPSTRSFIDGVPWEGREAQFLHRPHRESNHCVAVPYTTAAPRQLHRAMKIAILDYTGRLARVGLPALESTQNPLKCCEKKCPRIRRAITFGFKIKTQDAAYM